MSSDSETDPEIESLDTPKRNVDTLTESEGKVIISILMDKFVHISVNRF